MSRRKRKIDVWLRQTGQRIRRRENRKVQPDEIPEEFRTTAYTARYNNEPCEVCGGSFERFRCTGCGAERRPEINEL